ncbi:MAG: ThiF family adenylyltransferase [Dehalococcoidales bacterium]|nr:ThiF family adenylyltransferase [Dehalococcoidales bacterium]
MYTLDNDFATRFKYEVMIVGCGGTGGFVAEGLCRLLPVNVPLVLVDPDHVEERNLRRQNFFLEDLGELKSEALAHRLSRKYHRAIAYSILPVSLTPLGFNSLVIGCVDNGPARRDIASRFTATYGNAPAWWVDAGNGENFGQILIGNRIGTAQYRTSEKGDRFYSLPLPTQQRPDLLRQQPAVSSCADIEEQGPTINQSMAALVIEVVRRLIAGTCPWIQLYLDLELGTLQPVLVTPETVEEILKKKSVKAKK